MLRIYYYLSSFPLVLVMIRMARSVGTEKMVDALAESVRPRMNGKDSTALSAFQSILSEGLTKAGGATNNMLLW